MRKDIMFRSICLSLLVLGALLAVGCASASGPVVDEVLPTIESVSDPSEVAGPQTADVRGIAPQDLVRVREQHASLISTIPTPTLFPTRPPEEVASVYLLTGEDVSDDAMAESFETDPAMGIWWFRKSGGDWTTRRIRETNPYAPLFYSGEYRAEHPSFGDQGMQELIAQRLAEGAELLLPEIRGRGATLVSPLASNLGWEIASGELPVVRVWSHFTYLGPLDDGAREYRVGGALAFGVQDYVDPVSGNVIYQYLVMDRFLGNGVLLEDAGPLVDPGTGRR